MTSKQADAIIALLRANPGVVSPGELSRLLLDVKLAVDDATEADDTVDWTNAYSRYDSAAD